MEELQRRRIRTLLCWLMSIGSWGFWSCDAGSDAGGGRKKQEFLTIMTWNVQTLFDSTEAGNEYAEYLKSAGWSAEKYTGRLNAMAQAIGALDSGAPDILALEEVENAGILEDLASGALSRHGYCWNFFAHISGASLGIGVLSQLPLIKAKAHSLTANGEMVPRPVVEVWVQNGDQPLALFVCHWKSKLGGEAATEALRRASARILLRRMREIQRENPGVPIVIMGDLNENHDEFYRKGGVVISALLPDDPRAAALTGFGGLGEDRAEELQGDFLILSKNKPPEALHFPSGALALYSPWDRELESGSYYYQDNWETIDHFLLSGEFFDNSGWEFETAHRVDQAPFTSARGIPHSYNPRTGSGLSDHLPLILVLKRTGAPAGQAG